MVRLGVNHSAAHILYFCVTYCEGERESELLVCIMYEPIVSGTSRLYSLAYLYLGFWTVCCLSFCLWNFWTSTASLGTSLPQYFRSCAKFLPLCSPSVPFLSVISATSQHTPLKNHSPNSFSEPGSCWRLGTLFFVNALSMSTSLSVSVAVKIQM